VSSEIVKLQYIRDQGGGNLASWATEPAPVFYYKPTVL
jgi:hypothetical protein